MKCRVLPLAAVGLSLALGCTSQPVILPSRDLDRPTDVTFICMGAFSPTPVSTPDAGTADGGATVAPGSLVLSGRPMRECHPRGQYDPVSDPEHHTFAFIPNSSSGQLAVVDTAPWHILDLDPSISGYNQAPLGVLPTQIAASDDGCRLVTANHGSCDLSLVDPAALMAPTLAATIPGLSVPIGGAANPLITQSVIPRTHAGLPLNLIAQEITFLPQKTADMKGSAHLCGSSPLPHALVTFPSCDLIALIELPSGTILDSVHVLGTGVDGQGVTLEHAGSDPVCPVKDCGSTNRILPDGGPADTMSDATPRADAGPEAAASDAATGDADEAGGADGGAPAPDAGQGETSPPAGPPATQAFTPAGPRPGPIAIVPENGHTYVGLTNAPYVLSFIVSEDSDKIDIDSQKAIHLSDDALGVTRVRLSLDPYRDKTTDGIAGRFIGDIAERQYLYAIARDGSVRVVQAANRADIECETNIDPLSFPANTRTATLESACIPVDPAHRRPTAFSPGIRLPSLPIDITAVDVRAVPPDQREQSVMGAHAYILTASGLVYLVNIDPVPRLTRYIEPGGTVRACDVQVPEQCQPEDPPLANTLRNRNVLSYGRTLDTSSGLARVDLPVTAGPQTPRIESIWTRGTADNAAALSGDYMPTQIFFPDPSAVQPQTWSVIWEGALTPTPRFSGQVKQDAPGQPVFLEDLGTDFCRIGLQPDDLVSLHGCVDNTECGLGKTCIHGNEGTQGAGAIPINGLCVDQNTSQVDGGTKQSVCEHLLSTVRRYDVEVARPSQLTLRPHKDELVRPNLKPCVVKIGAGTTDAGTTDGAAPDGGVGDSSADANANLDGATASPDGAATDGGSEGGATGVPDSDCHDPSDPSTALFQCLGGRCLMPCETPDDTRGCRSGRICVSFKPDGSCGSKADPSCFCADGPDLARGEFRTTCIGDELISYQAHVGRGFLVVGSQTGILLTPTSMTVSIDGDPQPRCAPHTVPDPRLAMRISMNDPHCDDVVDNTRDSRCNPGSPTSTCHMPGLVLPDPMKPDDNVQKAYDDRVRSEAAALLNIAKSERGTPNPCLFLGGPNETDLSRQSPQHVHALFRNTEIQFMMTNLEKSPAGFMQLRFDVNGGFRPQVVALPGTVEVSMPARIVLGPFDAEVQEDAFTKTPTPSEIPYIFVVDQRRLGRTQGGGPTRGQLLRINPVGFQITTPSPGLQPWYEDFQHSGSLFPIQ
jgi:hypothetical protein